MAKYRTKFFFAPLSFPNDEPLKLRNFKVSGVQPSFPFFQTLNIAKDL